MFGCESESLYFCAKLYKPMTMKTIKIFLLLFVAMVMSSVAYAQVINGDMNHNGKLDLSDVTQLISNYLTGTSEEINGADNSRIVGTWYKSEKESITFNADGTTDYAKGYTYECLPQGFVLFYNVSGTLVHVMRLVEATTDSIVVLPIGSDIPECYLASLPEPAPGNNDKHEYVDLGLSVMWATTNVGAKSPEDYGDYFAWGETETKDVYDWSTYKYCKGSMNTLTKYNTKGTYGSSDNKKVLEPEDDAACQNWGGAWRMPTYDEWSELVTKCTWTWTTLNGINGYSVKGPSGKSIFLPAAGLRDGSALNHVGVYGMFWSSSLDTSAPSNGRNLNFYSPKVYLGSNYRFYGRTVRAVCK